MHIYIHTTRETFRTSIRIHIHLRISSHVCKWMRCGAVCFVDVLILTTTTTNVFYFSEQAKKSKERERKEDMFVKYNEEKWKEKKRFNLKAIQCFHIICQTMDWMDQMIQTFDEKGKCTRASAHARTHACTYAFSFARSRSWKLNSISVQ